MMTMLSSSRVADVEVFAVLTRLLLGSLLFSSYVKADELDIPFHPRFPSASFPFARTEKGCQPWQKPKGFSQFGSLDFGAACHAYHQCFYSVSESFANCHVLFLTQLRQTCETELTRIKLERGEPGEPDSQALHLCFDFVDLFLIRVQEPTALKRYAEAQKEQFAYEEHVRGVIQALYVEMLRRPATAIEERQALQRLKDGVSLRKIREVLAQSKADRQTNLSQLHPSEELPSLKEEDLAGLDVSASTRKKDHLK